MFKMSTQPGDKCAARQYSDQMQCAACRLTWDTNDTDPPPCPRLVKAKPSPFDSRLLSGFVSGCFRDER